MMCTELTWSKPVSTSILISAIAPVIFVLALGFAAGKHKRFSEEQARGFSRLALTYALPAALFLSMAHFDRSLLMQQGPIAVVMLIGYSGLYLALYWLLRAFDMGKLKAALLGYTFASTAVPIYGLTVLTPIYGGQIAAGIVGLAALVTNLAQVSVAVFLLQSAFSESGSAKNGAVNKGQAASVVRTLADSAANPLVWAPVLGAIVALLGLPLSPYVSTALNPLAVSAAGVAIFASGLVLAAHQIKLTSSTVIVGSLVSLVVQPALFFAMIKVAGLSGAMAHAVFVASTMPTGTPSVLFAQQYKSCEAETASIMLVTTLGMLVALPASIALSAFL
jgi:malonate transporter and related proteins